MKIRPLILSAAAVLASLTTAQGGAFTLDWNFGTGASSLAASSGTPFASTVGNFSIGNPVGGTYSTTNPNSLTASTGYASASGNFNYDNAAVAGGLVTGTSSYYSVTITPNAGNIVQILDFDFGARSVTTTGPLSYVLRWGVDSFAANITSGTFTADSTWAFKNNTFSTVTSSSPGTAVELRLYTFGGTGGSANTPTILIDDVRLAAAVPEASTYAAAVGCAAIIGFSWLRRSRKQA
jgi:hypothetical protein